MRTGGAQVGDQKTAEDTLLVHLAQLFFSGGVKRLCLGLRLSYGLDGCRCSALVCLHGLIPSLDLSASALR